MEIVFKLRADDDVVGAAYVIDPDSCAAAFIGDEIGEGIFCASGLWCALPAVRSECLGLRHEHAVVAAIVNGYMVKLIVVTPAHEDKAGSGKSRTRRSGHLQ